MGTSLRKRVFSLRQNLDTSLYKNVSTFLKETIILSASPIQLTWYFIASTVLDRLTYCWVILQPNYPKHDPCFNDACIFFEKLKLLTSNVKTQTLARSSLSLQTIFGPGRIDCSIQMQMRYISILSVSEKLPVSKFPYFGKYIIQL